MENLYPYQEKLLAKHKEKLFVLWPCGRGKTRFACEWAKSWGGSTLVVTTKGLQTQWKRQMELWGAKGEVISKENFKKGVKRYDNLIVDEADFFLAANFSSQLSKSLKQYLKTREPRVCLMSATIFRSTPFNVYTASVLLGYKWNYADFRHTFFSLVSMGFRAIWLPRKDGATKAKLRKLIDGMCETISEEDDFDIPTHTYETVLINEDESQRIAKKGNKEVHPMSRFIVDHKAEAFNKNKFEAIDLLCKERDKTIVVCRYIEQMEVLADYLKANGHETVLKIWGGNDDRQAVIDQAEGAETAVVIVQADTVQGYELPSFRLMIFASQSYSLYSHTQVVGRNERVNALAKNTYIYLHAGDSDKAVYKSIKNNEDFDPILYYKNTHARAENHRQNLEINAR